MGWGEFNGRVLLNDLDISADIRPWEKMRAAQLLWEWRRDCLIQVEICLREGGQKGRNDCQ